MNTTQISYIVFGIVLILAVIFDLGLLSKRNTEVTIRKAFLQTLFWVILAFGFFSFIWIEKGHTVALEYISAYLMEWSLSIDNIFVFILIFTFFKVKEEHYARVLMIGILLAIIFRLAFITLGVALVSRFEWVLYIFGAVLVYTGIKIFAVKGEKEYEPQKSLIYRWVTKTVPIIPEDKNGKITVRKDGKLFFTSIFVVIILLASTDIIFAMDSIPAVFAISQNKLVIYTSNIFAVLGLRSLFFLLQGAIYKFKYLQQGIAIVLIFIGCKMLAEHWLYKWKISRTEQVFISLGVIIIFISGAILLSVFKNKKSKKD